MDENMTEIPKFISYDFIQRCETPGEKRARESVAWYPGVEGWVSTPKVEEEMDPSDQQHPDISKATEVMMEDLAGMCYDVKDERWTQCFALEETGEIRSNHSYLANKRDAHGGREIPEGEANELIAHVSKASGRITVRGCKADHKKLAITKCEETHESLSGFYIGSKHFLTAAHFNLCHKTEHAMKIEESGCARVTTEREPSGTYGAKGAYLIHRDTGKDFAIFHLDAKEDTPKYSIAVEQLKCVDEVDFGRDLENRRVFTIGYNSEYLKDHFSAASQAALKDVLTSPFKKKISKSKLDEETPSFEIVFKPGRKTFCLGRLSDMMKTGVNNTWWKHRVTGWHGISGAMIACLDDSNGTGPRILILGIFNGGELGNLNSMLPFKTDVYEKILQIVNEGDVDQDQEEDCLRAVVDDPLV